MIIKTRFTSVTYKHPIAGIIFDAITSDRCYGDALWISDHDTIASIEFNVKRIIDELIPYDKGVTQP